MTKDRAEMLVEEAGRCISAFEWGTAVLNGHFTDEQLDAVAFLMRSARDGRKTHSR